MKIISLAGLPEEGLSHNPEIKKRVILRRGEVPHLTNFSRSAMRPGQATRPHRHERMCEIFYIESGGGLVRIDGREQQVRAGDCVVIEPGEAHEIVNTGSEDLVLSYFGIEV